NAALFLSPLAAVEPVSERAWPFRRKRPVRRNSGKPGHRDGVNLKFFRPSASALPPRGAAILSVGRYIGSSPQTTCDPRLRHLHKKSIFCTKSPPLVELYVQSRAHQSVALRSPAGLIRRIAGTLLPIRPPGGEAQSTRPVETITPVRDLPRPPRDKVRVLTNKPRGGRSRFARASSCRDRGRPRLPQPTIRRHPKSRRCLCRRMTGRRAKQGRASWRPCAASD